MFHRFGGKVTAVKLRQIEPAKRVGLIIVLTGDGTGKTTAALGIAVRSVTGCGSV
jgi:ATP:corrinoid adenosyltransferase